MAPVVRLLAVGGIGVVAVTLAANVAVHLLSWGRRRTPTELQAGHGPEVVMVLGAGVRNADPTPYLAARLDMALRLWRDNAASAILVSGWARAGEDSGAADYDEPAVMAAYLIKRGVPEASVLRDPAGLDTWTSAVRARRLWGLESLVVVTQAYHLPRAVAAARLAGIRVLGVADTTRDHNAKWWRYRLREIPACVKLMAEWALSNRVAPRR